MGTIFVNSELRTISPGCTVANLLTELGKDPKKLAVEVNETVVPRAEHAIRLLQDGDRIEIVTLVGGG
jgi:thiamine biosynthesis protein ThiS